MSRVVYRSPLPDVEIPDVSLTTFVLERAFEYWHNVDKNLGDRIETGVRSKQSGSLPEATKR